MAETPSARPARPGPPASPGSPGSPGSPASPGSPGSPGSPASPPDPADRIRDAALRLFNERGYGSATVEAIAEAAGVGVGTIYRRWPDKPALANHVFGWAEDSIIEAIAGAPLEAQAGKPQFLELWRRTWAFATRHPQRLVFVEGHTHEAFLDDDNRAKKRQFLEHVAQVFGRIGVRAPADLAISMITGTLVHLIRNGVPAEPDDVGERLWQALRPPADELAGHAGGR